MFHADLIGTNLHIGRSNSGGGSPIGVVTPGIVGEFWFDTASGELWVADGLTDADWVLVSGGGLRFTPVIGDKFRIAGWTPAAVKVAFDQTWQDMHKGSWDSLYKYLWWTFYCPQTDIRDDTPRRFNSISDLVDHMVPIVTLSGGLFNGICHFQAYDIEDQKDPYPMRRHVRSSMLASMLPDLGGTPWLRRRPGERSGVNARFNFGVYYLNWTNDLARQLVIWYTNVRVGVPQVPLTNDDGAIWYTEGKRGGIYNWPGPTVGPFSYAKPAAWDMLTATWATPATTNSYTTMPPFILYEANKSHFLQIAEMSDHSTMTYLRNAPAIAVFPVVESGRYLAFVFTPCGVDTWATEWLDDATYEMTIRVRYRHEFGDRFHTIPVKSHDGTERSMFSAYGSGFTNLFFVRKAPGGFQHLDDNMLPSKVYMARRNLSTGVRSPWKELAVLRRRIPHIDWRMDPAFRIGG